MKTVSLFGLVVVLSLVALHSAGAEEAMRELDPALREIDMRELEEAMRELDPALREIDMRELEEALRDLEGLQSEIREPLNGNRDEKLQKRFLGSLIGLGWRLGKKIYNMAKGNGR